MTRKIFLFILSCLCVLQVLAQSTQPCVVSEYRGKEAKAPLQGVSVTAANAGTVMSDAEGALTLQFRTLKVGDQIQFRRIDKAGYEVMNSEVLEAARVMRQRSEATLHIVLAPSKLLRQLRDGYRSVASQRYQKQMKEAEAEAERLKAEGKLLEEEYNERMDALEAEYEDKLSHLESYIDKFTRIDLSDLDQDEQQIMDLVQAGDFDQALQLYDNQDLGNRLQQSRADRQKLADAREQIAQAERQKERENLRLRQSIDRQVTLLRMAGGKENLQKAYRILHETFLADTTHVDARRDYAKSLFEQGDIEESEAVLQHGIASTADDFGRGMMILDLMDICGFASDLETTYEYAQQARHIMEPLQESNYQALTRGLPAYSSIELMYYLNNDDFASCRAVIDDVNRHWSLDSLQSSSVVSYVELLTQMSLYYVATENHELNLKCIQQSLQLGEYLYERWPWLSTLHDTYAEAASFYALHSMEAEAIEAARRSFQIIVDRINQYNILSEYQNYGYELYIITDALNMLEQYDLNDSIIAQSNALKVYETLDAAYPGTYDLYHGLYRMNSIIPALHQGNIQEAEQHYTKAIELLSDTDDGQAVLAQLQYGMLAQIRQAQEEFTEAEQLYREAIRFFADAYSEDNSALNADQQCRLLCQLAAMQLGQGRNKEAQKTLKEAEKVAVFDNGRRKIADLMMLIKK